MIDRTELIKEKLKRDYEDIPRRLKSQAVHALDRISPIDWENLTEKQIVVLQEKYGYIDYFIYTLSVELKYIDDYLDVEVEE